jgi:hypothetical protein
MRCRLVELLIVLAACGHAAAPPPLLSNHSPSVIVRWVGEDDSHWKYDLTIDGDSFRQIVDQGAAKCVQAGRIERTATELVRTFDQNDCNNLYVGKTVRDTIVTSTDKQLVVRMEGHTVIRYDRAP